MCGIVGVVLKNNGGFFKKQEDTFMQMLLADQVRGEDSTGIIGIEKDSTFYTAKEATNATVFIPKYKQTVLSTSMWNQGKAYIGHNRKKTVGVISDETAHPFVVNNTFAMVHNGTLHQHDKLAANCDVDSEALAIHLHAALKAAWEDGDKKTDKYFEEALSKVYGAYAVAMYDQQRHKVFLTRNKERPLSIIETDDAWYFMSESLMGAWIANRNGYDYDKLKVSGIKEYEVITFDLDKSTMGREQLNPKKSNAVLGKWTNTGGKKSNVTDANTKSSGTTLELGAEFTPKVGKACTEAEFKRLRNELLGKRVTVVVDDLLEEHYPIERLEWGNATKLMLFAQSTLIPFMHTINIPIDLTATGIYTGEEILGKKWVVSLEAMEHCSYGGIVIEGTDPKLVVSDLTGNVTHKEFRSGLPKLTFEELRALEEEVKFSGAQWQSNAIKGEIAWRQGCSSLVEAHKRAKNRGVILTQVKRDGYFVYQDTEGNVYYETPIAVQ